MTYLATIPFSGFYCSIHSGEIDRTIEHMLTDRDSGCEFAPSWLCEIATDSIDYSGVYRAYARDYAESFCDWLGLDAKFESMTSPRYYNFETDRIFVELTRGDIVRMWRGIDKADLDKACKARFTSCDGFCSSYSNDWRSWGRLSEWDHNQLGTLVSVFAETEQGGDFDQWAEFELMESASGNGYIDQWICENAGDKFHRALNAWHAARRAENRPFNITPLG